jgi:hypothetical protein
MNRADSVSMIVIAREQHLGFGLTQVMLQPLNEWSQLLERGFIFFCKFKEHSSIVDLRLKLFLASYLSFDAAAFLEKFLCRLLIVPEVGCRGLRLDAS